MQLYLCSTIGEIRHRMAFPRNPLNILQVVNLYPPQDWVFRFHFDAIGKIALDIEFGGEDFDSFYAISSGLLSAFDCDRMEVHRSGAVWACDWRRGLGYHAEQNVLEYFATPELSNKRSFIRLLGFGGGALPQQFSNWSLVASYLHDKTWFGSYALKRERFKIEIAVFDNRRTFKNYSLFDDRLKKLHRDGVPTLLLSQTIGSPAIGEVYLLSTAADSALTFRWTYGGVVQISDLKDMLGLNLFGCEFKGELEVAFPARQLGPDGTIAMDEQFGQVVAATGKIMQGLNDSAKVKQYRLDCAEFEKKASARRIDQRKEQLLGTKFVYCNDKLVYKVPTNEMETVSFHQKLEGMGGLPFASFVSLEYTPKLGIDAIVNFMISDTEAIHRLATVEFEYKFESFFAHAHPVEQTDMIICWEGARASQSGEWDYKPDPQRPWLGYLHVNGKVIKVAEASKYPGLELKGIK